MHPNHWLSLWSNEQSQLIGLNINTTLRGVTSPASSAYCKTFYRGVSYFNIISLFGRWMWIRVIKYHKPFVSLWNRSKNRFPSCWLIYGVVLSTKAFHYWKLKHEPLIIQRMWSLSSAWIWTNPFATAGLLFPWKRSAKVTNERNVFIICRT